MKYFNDEKYITEKKPQIIYSYINAEEIGSYLFIKNIYNDLINNNTMNNNTKKKGSKIMKNISSENMDYFYGKMNYDNFSILNRSIIQNRNSNFRILNSSKEKLRKNKINDVPLYTECNSNKNFLLSNDYTNNSNESNNKNKIDNVLSGSNVTSSNNNIGSESTNNNEELEMELKEQRKIESINKEFTRFALSVEDLGEIKFDVPFRELQFNGVPNKSCVTLFPTQNCIISLTEQPFFVITIKEIDLIYFERVAQSLKNFDMAFVFKDLSKPVKRIGAIPMEHLDMLKTWADSNDIYFSEGLFNMNWANIINSIKNDPNTFVEDGCWNILAENASDEEEEEEGENPDSEYEEEEIESSESDYDDDEEEEVESEGENEGDSALSEEGKPWAELNKEARESDKDHAKKMKGEEKFKKNKNNKK